MKLTKQPQAKPLEFVNFDLNKHGVTQSILTTWMTCRQKAKLKIEGWSPIAPRLPMAFGSMAHEVIADTFQKFTAPPSPKEINKMLKNAIKKGIDESDGRISTEKMEEFASVLSVVFPHYFAKWKDDFKKLTWTNIESEFDVKTPGVNFRRLGKFDRVFKINKNEHWLVETKTKSRIEEDTIIEALHFDFQIGYYLEALLEILKLAPKGVIYDILRRPQLQQKQKETLRQFYQRLDDDIGERPEFYFMRYEVSISKKELQDFAESLKTIGMEFESWARGKSPTWKNSTACVGRYGACEFLPICSRGDYDGFFKRKNLHPELASQQAGE